MEALQIRDLVCAARDQQLTHHNMRKVWGNSAQQVSRLALRQVPQAMQQQCGLGRCSAAGRGPSKRFGGRLDDVSATGVVDACWGCTKDAKLLDAGWDSTPGLRSEVVGWRVRDGECGAGSGWRG